MTVAWRERFTKSENGAITGMVRAALAEPEGIITLIIFSFSVLSCSVETGEGGFRSTDKQYTKYLYKELNKLNFSYTVDSEGFIRYSKTDEPDFKKAQNMVNHILYEGTSNKPHDESDKQLLIDTLKKNKLEHYLIEQEDGIWVKWYPESDEHRQKLIIQIFEEKANRMKSTDCNNPCSKKTSNN